MQRYKSLEDLGVKPEDCYQNWMEDINESDARIDVWKQQKEEYGIDERATWNWSDDFLDYIYIHLEMFNRINIVDFNREYIKYNDETMTVQSAIDKILNWFQTRYYPNKNDTIEFDNYEDKDKYIEDLEVWCNERQSMVELFAKISMHLNW